MSVISRRTAAEPSEKTTSVTMLLDNLLKDKQCSKVPAIILKKTQEAYAALLAIESEASLKLKVKCPLDLNFTLEEVTAATEEALTCKIVLANVRNSVRGL